MWPLKTVVWKTHSSGGKGLIYNIKVEFKIYLCVSLKRLVRIFLSTIKLRSLRGVNTEDCFHAVLKSPQFL